MKKFYSLVLLIGVMMAFCVPAGAETVTMQASFANVSTAGTAPNTFTAKDGTVQNKYYKLQKGYIISDKTYTIDPSQDISITMKVGTFGNFSTGKQDVSFCVVDKNGNVVSTTFSTSFTKGNSDGGTYSGTVKLNEGQEGRDVYFKIVSSSTAETEKCARFYDLSITYTPISVTTYSISCQSLTGGTIKADKSSAAEGDKVTLSYTENEGYYFDGWTVLNAAETIAVNENSFTMPAAAVTVKGKFTACTKLDAPQNLKVSDITTNSATLSWGAVTKAKEYSIYIIDGESYEKTLTTSEVSHTITGLSPETKYSVAVSAVGDGHHYCESLGVDADFTTQALPKYTITWSAPDGGQTTTVTQGEKVVLPTAIPVSCSLTYTQFVGWFTEAAGTDSNPATTKPATQVTAATVPTGNATYYAVFCDAVGGGELTLATSVENGDIVYLAKSTTGDGVTGYNGTKDATVSSTKANWMAFEVVATTSGFKLKNNAGNYVTIAQGSFKLTKDGTDLVLEKDGRFPTAGITKYYLQQNDTYYRGYANKETYQQFYMYKGGTVATGYVSSCCEDAAVVTVTPAATEVNLGENGTAATTVSCTQTGGGEGSWSYSVTPATATFDGVNFSATAAGTYTLYATYTENCGKSGKATIKVTKNPVFGTASIDKSEFAVSCGDTTSMNSAATISLGTNYNLTKTVTVTAPEGFVVSTNKTDRTKYAQSVTLTPTASGANKGKITGNVYVRAYSAIARADGYSGEITIAGDEITTQKLAVSSTVTCTEYALLLSDRGTTTTAGNYYAGAEVPQPADPTGVCAEPYNYIFDGWAEATVNDGATSYTKVAFPYTMPKNGATLYAVYRYVASGSNDFVIADADEDLFSGNEYILTGAYSGAEYALTCTPSTTVTGKMTSAEVTVTEVTEGDNTSYEIQNVADKTIIWKLIGDKTNGYAFQNLNTGTYLMAASTTSTSTSTGLSMGETTTTVYQISHPSATEWPVVVKQPTGTYYLSAYDKSDIVYFSEHKSNTLNLYLYTRKYAFTSMPLCDCVYFVAPVVTVVATTATTASLSWAEIADANGYEYSFDQNNWTTATTTTADGRVSTTLTGLENSKDYSVYVRGKAADGEKNCAAVATVEFTTKECDDVPTGLTATATANSVTVSWKCQAATATVGVYADAACESLVVEKTGAKSPCMISGLTPNTKYYYRVLAGGSCASTTETFSTEATNVSVVEWKKDAVVVELNTEGDDVRVIIEGQTSHGDKTKNVADDLFFSKYYEATGNVKLLGIYNGTLDTISLSNVSIKIGVDSWSSSMSLASYGHYSKGKIAPNEEIILWCRGSSSINTPDYRITTCAEELLGDKINEFYENTSVVYSGAQNIALVRGTEYIDLIGAFADTGKDPKKGDCVPSWGDITKSGAKVTWCGKGYSIEDNTTEIDLSMNRCLLVRSNTVKSGKNAITNNIGAFSTFTKEEWLGRQVSKKNSSGVDDDGVEASCDGFAYVADFNYNNYYISYDSITSMDIQGKQNPDGSYTIPIDRLDTMACTSMRIEVKQNGVVVATKDQRVPIVVTVNSDTGDTLFTNDRLSAEICKTCDVVVRDKAKLSHTSTGVNQFRNMYVYAGAKLEIPAEETFTLATAHLHGLNDSVAYAIINNGGEITIDKLVHVKRIDGKYWYPFALPYDCNIADICQLSGLSLGTYGVDWGIKYYDGEKRQKDGNSMTTFGEVSKYWTMMAADGTLKAHTGYIIGLFYDNENLMRSIYFTPASANNYVENGDAKTTQVTNWPDNLTADARHHGWNFVGSPYISLFGSGSGNEGIYNNSLQMGYTQRDGTQADIEHVYVSIPDGGNTNTYTQALASATTLKPFTAYFVQAVDPTDGTSHQLDLTYSKGNRSLPSRVAMAESAADEPILVEMTLTGADTTMTDNAGVWMSNRYSTDYEIGDDLYKMYAESTKPQLYTTDAAGLRMAYLAVPDQATIPVGLYAPAAGTYTLSLNEAVSRLGAAQAVYLLHNGTTVADLMSDKYTINASQRGTVGGYALAIRRAPHTTTDIDNAEAPHAAFVDGQIVVSHLPENAMVRVYDVLGHLCYNATATESAVEVSAAVRGVYTIVVATGNAQTVLKTLAY